MLPRLVITALAAVLLPYSTAAFARAPENCEITKQVQGQWDVTTRVTVSKSKGGMGVTGFYNLQFEADGCRLRVSATKSGYASKVYLPDEVLRGSAKVTVATIGEGEMKRVGEYLLSFHLGLKSDKGDEVAMQFEVIWTPKKLFGRWQYAGAAWEKAGMAGYLLGERGGKGGRVKFASPRAIPCDRVCELNGLYYESNSSFMCQESCAAEGPSTPLIQ